jgi:hypothetical protein
MEDLSVSLTIGSSNSLPEIEDINYGFLLEKFILNPFPLTKAQISLICNQETISEEPIVVSPNTHEYITPFLGFFKKNTIDYLLTSFPQTGFSDSTFLFPLCQYLFLFNGTQILVK